MGTVAAAVVLDDADLATGTLVDEEVEEEVERLMMKSQLRGSCHDHYDCFGRNVHLAWPE